MAGPETALATGVPLPDLISDAPLPPDGSLVDPAMANGAIEAGVTKPVNETIVEETITPGRRPRRGVDASGFNPAVRYEQEDFYGKNNPEITWTDPRGVKMYVPKAGELPMAIWASKMQTVQKDRAANKKAIADLLSGSGVPQTAPPYQADFSKFVTSGQNTFIDRYAAQYGGDRDLALQEIATPGSPANQDWRRQNADFEAIGQFLKYGWEDASDWIKEVSKGDLEPYAPMRQNAQELAYGMGSLKAADSTGGDYAKAVQAIGKVQRDMSLSKFGREMVLPHLPEVYQKLESEPIYEVKNGQRIVRTRTKEELQDAFYDSMTREAKKLIPGLSDDYIRKYIETIVPRVKSDLVDVKAANIPVVNKSDGGSGETGTWFGNVESGVSSIRIPEYSMGDAIRGASPRTPKETVDRLPIGEIVSKRQQNMGPRKFTDRKGDPVEMRPQYIERTQNGDMFIVGRPVAPEEINTDTQDVVTEVDITPAGSPEGTVVKKKTTARAATKPQPEWISVPLSQNEATIDRYMGGPQWRKAFGPVRSQAAPQSAPSKPKTVVQNGVTYTLDPATGQYQ